MWLLLRYIEQLVVILESTLDYLEIILGCLWVYLRVTVGILTLHRPSNAYHVVCIRFNVLINRNYIYFRRNLLSKKDLRIFGKRPTSSPLRRDGVDGMETSPEEIRLEALRGLEGSNLNDCSYTHRGAKPRRITTNAVPSFSLLYHSLLLIALTSIAEHWVGDALADAPV